MTQPVADGFDRELAAVVGPDLIEHTVGYEQRRQTFQHVLVGQQSSRVDGQTFAADPARGTPGVPKRPCDPAHHAHRQLPVVAWPGSAVWTCRLTQDGLVQLRLVRQRLEPSILPFQILQSLGPVRAQTAILFAPAVIRLLGHLQLLADLRDLQAFRQFNLHLRQLGDDLLRSVPLLGHVLALSAMRPYRIHSHSTWTRFRGHSQNQTLLIKTPRNIGATIHLATSAWRGPMARFSVLRIVVLAWVVVSVTVGSARASVITTGDVDPGGAATQPDP